MVKTSVLICVAILTSACVAPASDMPALRVIADSRVSVRQGELAYESLTDWLGVGFVLATDEPQCFQVKPGPTSCAINVNLTVAPLRQMGEAGNADLETNQIVIDPDTNDTDFEMATTHEIGHIVMHSRNHLEDLGLSGGIMSNVSNTGYITSVDVEMLCTLTGLACP